MRGMDPGRRPACPRGARVGIRSALSGDHTTKSAWITRKPPDHPGPCGIHLRGCGRLGPHTHLVYGLPSRLLLVTVSPPPTEEEANNMASCSWLQAPALLTILRGCCAADGRLCWLEAEERNPRPVFPGTPDGQGATTPPPPPPLRSPPVCPNDDDQGATSHAARHRMADGGGRPSSTGRGGRGGDGHRPPSRLRLPHLSPPSPGAPRRMTNSKPR